MPLSVSAAKEPTRGGGCEPNRAGFGAGTNEVSGLTTHQCVRATRLPNTALTLSAAVPDSAQHSAAKSSPRANIGLLPKRLARQALSPAATKRLQTRYQLRMPRSKAQANTR